MDISAPLGAKVCAISGGVVRDIQNDDMMGTGIIIEHDKTLSSVYENLAGTVNVKIGDKVSAGQVIGTVGGSAAAESGDPSHLHLEVIKNGVRVDPATVLPKSS